MSQASPRPVTKNELIKQRDPALAGTIAATLADPAADRFSEDDEQFLKFHGIYQQDDRDKRKSGREYIFMVRGRIPGGIVTPEQYVAFDELATRYGNNTLRITTRQSFQWHGVAKKGLGPLMRAINESLATTIASCGDVARNVMAPPTPATGPLTAEVQADAALLSSALAPRTRAYHQIWVDGVPLNLTDDRPPGQPPLARTCGGADLGVRSAPPPADSDLSEFVDPLYGRAYLPRKFKTAFAIPPLNDTDVFTNCLGFVAIADPADPGVLLGYNLLAGGGLGTSHGNKETYPRMADVVGFVPRQRLAEAARAVLTVHRDFGDRSNRRHARLKYVIEEQGVGWFRREVEGRAGFEFEPARPFRFERQGDLYGWHRQTDGNWFLGLFVETGRVKDSPERRLKTALRGIAELHRPEIRLTPSQNLLLTGIAPPDKASIEAILEKNGVKVERQASAVRAASMACPALPTCGLALAESERVLPALVTELEALLVELGLGDAGITVRMTGCPNGCARPYLAELGLVGRGPDKYNVYLGGNLSSTRLNRLYRESVPGAGIAALLRPVLAGYSSTRTPGEGFGDYCARHAEALGLAAPALAQKSPGISATTPDEAAA